MRTGFFAADKLFGTDHRDRPSWLSIFAQYAALMRADSRFETGGMADIVRTVGPAEDIHPHFPDDAAHWTLASRIRIRGSGTWEGVVAASADPHGVPDCRREHNLPIMLPETEVTWGMLN